MDTDDKLSFSNTSGQVTNSIEAAFLSGDYVISQSTIWLCLQCKLATHHESCKLENRGVGNPRAVRVFGDLVKSHNPNFVFLCETLVEDKTIKDLASRFGFAHSFAVDRIGRGGGLAIMWK